MADLWRDLWIRETGTGQQVVQLHDRYMMMMMMKMIFIFFMILADICSSVNKCLFSSCHEIGALVPTSVHRRLENLIKREGLRQTWCQRICYWWCPYTLCCWYTFIGYCWYKGQVNYYENHWSITGVESVIKVECFMSTWCGCCESELRCALTDCISSFTMCTVAYEKTSALRRKEV
jgi:hypothetical protein